MAIWFPTTTGESYNITIKPMLQVGLTAYSFEPFESQPFEVNLASKNLLDLSQVIIGRVWNDGTNADRAVVYIKCQPNSTYTISIESLGNISEVWYFEKDGARTNRTNGNVQITTTYTKTTERNSFYIGLQFNKTAISVSDFLRVKIQVEKRKCSD